MVFKRTKEKTALAQTVRKHVVEAFRELLSDPDVGRALRPAAEARLRRSVTSAQKGRVKDFAEVFRRFRV